MSLPKVSVVTPSYNQAQFLEKMIQSVLAQDYPNLEYRVYDGGSTDGSAALCAKYASRLAFWVSREDQGQADAINQGWRDSSGEIVAYLNADDQYKPGAVRRAVEFLQEHPETGIVYGSLSSRFENGSQRVIVPQKFDLRSFLLENFIPQPATFIRRSVLDRIGLMNPDLRYCLDYDLWMRAAASGVRFGRLDGEPLAIFRFWEGSKTSGDPEGWVKERIAVLESGFAAHGNGFPTEFQKYAKARSYLTVAYGVSLSGDSFSARRLLQKALELSPRVLLDSQFWRIKTTALLGNRVSRLLRRLKWRAGG